MPSWPSWRPGGPNNPQRHRHQLPSYPKSEWERLTQTCRAIVDESFTTHKRALTAPQHDEITRLRASTTAASRIPRLPDSATAGPEPELADADWDDEAGC